MDPDVVFIDLYNKLKGMVPKEKWKEVETKLLYIYLKPPSQCTPDVVMPLMVQPVYLPLGFSEDELRTAAESLFGLIVQRGCVSRDDAVSALSKPHRSEEMTELLMDTAAKLLMNNGLVVRRLDGTLCRAAQGAVDVQEIDTNYLFVRFRCRNGYTMSYTISPLEHAEEDLEEEEEL